MDTSDLDALFGDDSGAVDNVMLDVRGLGGGGSGSAASGGGGANAASGGGRAVRPPPAPPEFIPNQEAGAHLGGKMGDDFDTSCDELDEGEYAECEDDLDAEMDALYGDAVVDGMRTVNEVLALSAVGGGAAAPAARSHRGQRRRHTECFGCMFSSMNDASKADGSIEGNKMNDLISIFDHNFGRINNFDLSRLCHLYFKEEIYSPLRARGVNVRMWRTRSIYDHFIKHQLDPRVFIATALKDLEELRRGLMGACWERTKGGSGMQPNEKNISSVQRIIATQLRLYVQPVERLNFHNPERKIDFKAMGALLSGLRNFADGPTK